MATWVVRPGQREKIGREMTTEPKKVPEGCCKEMMSTASIPILFRAGKMVTARGGHAGPGRDLERVRDPVVTQLRIIRASIRARLFNKLRGNWNLYLRPNSNRFHPLHQLLRKTAPNVYMALKKIKYQLTIDPDSLTLPTANKKI